MVQARVVRLDGVGQPCILLSPHGDIPEELVVDFTDKTERVDRLSTGATTYRLEPSSVSEPEPAYRQLFDE